MSYLKIINTILKNNLLSWSKLSKTAKNGIKIQFLGYWS